MKNASNPVGEFKGQVARMAEYLKSVGYEVKQTHLLEAAARFEGVRDWRTHRASLSSQLPAEKPVLYPTPDLKGAAVRVYFEVHARSEWGDGPRACFTTINQAWVDRLFELRNLVHDKRLDSLDDEFDYPEYIDGDEYRLQGETVTVDRRCFWFSARPKHSDYKVETDTIDIDQFMVAVQAAIGRNEERLFFIEDQSQIDWIRYEVLGEEPTDEPDTAESASR